MEMNTKQLILMLFFAFAGTFVFAQDEDEEASDNLVPNGDFEKAETRTLKNLGMMQDLCENWYNATKAPCDLFSEGLKSDKVSIPDNLMGSQESASGALYAGFRAYSKDTKMSRSYLGVELTEQMEKNQMYCVEFKVSLSDLSKYGTNYIGAVFSDRKVIQPNTGAMVKDLNAIDVKHKSNKPMLMMDGWETICGTYIATGEEEYMMIGCFGSDSKLQTEKMKRPRGATGSQSYDAYYFIDDVNVSPIKAKSQCACDPSASQEPDLIYGQSTVVGPSMSSDDIVSVSAVYYASQKKNITGAGQSTLKEIVRIMNENPTWKMEVIGHCDNDEFDEEKINPRYRDMGQQRADQLVTYLASQGIDTSRLIPLSKSNTDPANTRPTDLSRAQNRRVVFKIRK